MLQSQERWWLLQTTLAVRGPLQTAKQVMIAASLGA